MPARAPHAIDQPASTFYVDALTVLEQAGVPSLIGGAFAYVCYTRVWRDTKDLDLFVKPEDCQRVLALFDDAGYRTELPFPHWLGKVYSDDRFIDVIFSSGNGLARVDDLWFVHGVDVEIFGLRLKLCPPEEMIWSKAFVQERERFDGGDVMHLLRALGSTLDWDRLLARFGRHWRVLLAHLVMFGFIYPDKRDQIPRGVIDELLRRLAAEVSSPGSHVCNGTLLSREQYLDDVESFGYADARIEPHGRMTREQVALWTAAILNS
jgi:hypothetical protein